MRIAFLVLLVAAAAPTLAPETSAQETRSFSSALADLRLATAAQLALVDDPRTRGLEVEVEARDGVLTVSGIEDAADQAAAAAVLRALPGVRGVEGLGAAPEAGERSGLGTGDAPAAGVVPVREAPRVHTVRRGDTLYSIARRYGTTPDALQDLNGLRSTDIRVGQQIRVR